MFRRKLILTDIDPKYEVISYSFYAVKVFYIITPKYYFISSKYTPFDSGREALAISSNGSLSLMNVLLFSR